MIATPIPRETLLHVVKSMPVAPRILAELGHLLLDPNSDMGEVTALLRRDTALTARIIRISNSAFYNTGHPYASLEEALARVGYMEVYRLTGIAAVSQVADKPLPLYGITGAQFRENSLLTALVAEALAMRVGLDFRLAYTAGLLRSIGKIGLDGVVRNGAYKGVYKRECGPLAEWETSFMGMSNCEAAAVILKEWRFPTVTIAGIREHYLTARENSPLGQLLNVAAGIAEKAGVALPGESTYWRAAPITLEGTELDAESVEEIATRACEAFDKMRCVVA
jgi:HD-like signal output (HDOD) protein